MRHLTFLSTSLGIIASLVSSPTQASERLKFNENPQNIKKQIIHTSDDELYQKALNYREGKIRGFPKEAPSTIKKAQSLFESLANKGHPQSMHKVGMSHYKKGDYLSAFNWFLQASERGVQASSQNLDSMKKSIAANKLKFKSFEEEQELKSLIRKIAFKESFGNEDANLLTIMPSEIMHNILRFLPLDQILPLQSISHRFNDVSESHFNLIDKKKVRPQDILYFYSLKGDNVTPDWKKLVIYG